MRSFTLSASSMPIRRNIACSRSCQATLCYTPRLQSKETKLSLNFNTIITDRSDDATGHDEALDQRVCFQALNVTNHRLYGFSTQQALP